MRFFDDPPHDDVALRRAAQPVAAGLNGRLPDAQWLRSLSHERGVDFATAVLYEAVMAHPGHGSFARHIESLAPAREGGAAGRLVLVPGLVWEDYPQLGADGQLIMDVARRLGFSVERIPVSGRATLSLNARTIVRFLEGLDAAEAWLVSLSKGSADLRFAMSGRFGLFPWHRFRGWVNICGSPNGSDLASLLTASPLRRLEARALCLASGIPFQAMLEISSRHSSWSGLPALPAGFRTINVVGMPLRWHLSRMLASRHRMLSSLGPNDGVVLCTNAFVSPGVVYPLWGYDHYFRGAEMVPLLYRLFAYVRASATRAAEADRQFAT
jgi:hypothetical protein